MTSGLSETSYSAAISSVVTTPDLQHAHTHTHTHRIRKRNRGVVREIRLKIEMKVDVFIWLFVRSHNEVRILRRN